MLISRTAPANYSNPTRNNSIAPSTSLQPAEPTDLVEIGKHTDTKDRFFDLGPVVTLFGAGVGTVGGGVAGTIAYACGGSGWLIPAVAIGGGILGGVIGYANEQ